MNENNVISVSGGKDSTALLLLAIERQAESMSAVFADTGNEHEQTYDYVRYLEQATGVPIRWVRADFSARIEAKKEYVLTKWEGKGVSQANIDRAAAALVPTGNPFLDLCIWKGRFPSTKAAFCSEDLKRNPIINQVQNPMLEAGDDVMSWQGVRRDESLNRRFLIESELKSTHENGAELWNYRPILDWTAEDAFAMHRKHGIKHNPLYEQGMGRVGCMPCINCRKDELLEISKRFPEAIERIRQWEAAVQAASKRNGATFFAAANKGKDLTVEECVAIGNIDQCVEWSQTKRGGGCLTCSACWMTDPCVHRFTVFVSNGEFMDEIDAAQERMEIDLGNSIRQARQGGPVAVATGRCLWCDDVTGDEQRWCNADCRNLWQKTAGAK